MKLLLDENLSPTLVYMIGDVYSGIAHVRDFGLKAAPDPKLWTFAATQGYTIVSKDADFHHRSFLQGHPPKVIWIRLGNCSTKALAALLMERQELIHSFHESAEHSFLLLY